MTADGGFETDIERLAEQQAPQVARRLKRIAQKGGTEADFRREPARILEEAAVAVGLSINPRDEYHVARGNVHSLYNRLVFEYKKPGVLRPANAAAPNNRARPHRDLGLQPPDPELDPETMPGTTLRRRDVLNGLIHKFHRSVA